MARDVFQNADGTPSGRSVPFPAQAFAKFIDEHAIDLGKLASTLDMSLTHLRRLKNGKVETTRESTLADFSRAIAALAKTMQVDIPPEFRMNREAREEDPLREDSANRVLKSTEEVNRDFATLIASATKPTDYYLAAHHLGYTYNTLKGLGAHTRMIRSITIRTMTDATMDRLQPFLPDGFRKDFNHNLNGIKTLFADRPEGFLRVVHWKRLALFHGIMFGAHLAWGKWDVDRRGRLSIDNGRMTVLSALNRNDVFEFGQYKRLFEFGDVLEEDWE